VSDVTSTDAPVAELPGDGLRESIVDDLRRHIGDGLVDFLLKPQDDLWIRVATDKWAATGRALQSMGFEYFCFLSAIDWKPSPFGRGEDDPTEPPPERKTEVVQGYAGGETRFQVFARLTDVRRHVGVTLKVDVPDDPLAIDSWHAIYAGANWHERETHEMYGISFPGHPDLRNIYLPTEFEGYPLRKDFPLLARIVKPWPGIVDVEPMPAAEEAEEAPAADAAGSAAAADASADSVSPQTTDSADLADTETETASAPSVTGTADEVEAIADAVADEAHSADEVAADADAPDVEAEPIEPGTPTADSPVDAESTEDAGPESEAAVHPESAAVPADATEETVADAPDHVAPDAAPDTSGSGSPTAERPEPDTNLPGETP